MKSKLLILEPKKERLIQFEELLQESYTILPVHSPEECMKELATWGDEVSLVLLSADLPEDSLMSSTLIQHSYYGDMTPMLLMVTDEQTVDLEAYFRHGVIDYFCYGMPPGAILKRIRNIEYYCLRKRSSVFREGGDSREQNAFLFHQVMDAAVLFNYDGQHLQALMINEAFYETVGYSRDYFSQYRHDMFEGILPEDQKAYRKALDDALSHGSSSLIMHQLDSHRIFKTRIRYLSRTAHGHLLFSTCEDVTGRPDEDMPMDVLTQLPGVILFDYLPPTDELTIYVSNENGLSTLREKDFLADHRHVRWLSPESERTFRTTITSAAKLSTSGQLDFRGRFGEKIYRWHRLFYKSMANPSQKVFRIIGRIDNIEQNKLARLSYANAGIYDAATELLTYNALREYLVKQLDSTDKGTVYLISLDGFYDLCMGMEQPEGKILSRRMIGSVFKLFKKDDLMGLFDKDCTIIFSSDVDDEETATNQALRIQRTIRDILEAEGRPLPIKIGVATTTPEDPSIEALINHAATALNHCRRIKDLSYVIYREQN